MTIQNDVFTASATSWFGDDDNLGVGTATAVQGRPYGSGGSMVI